MSINEIAQRNRAEEALRESEKKLRLSEQRLQQLVSNCPAALYTCKAFGDYSATFVSETITLQTGYETHEFIDDTSFWANHIHPDDRERVFAEMSRLSEEGQISCEYRFLHSDGTYRWMHDQSSILPDADGKPDEIVGFWKDITKRKQAEERLRQSEARLAEAERVGRIGHWDWNVVTDESHLSDEYFRIFGIEPQETGLTFDAFLAMVHPDDRENVRSETASALDKHDRHTIEYRIVRPNEEERVVHSECKISRGQNGHPLRMFGVVKDITEQKRVRQQMRKLEVELAHVARLSTMGEMGTGLAHELNQPLAAIVNYCTALQLSFRNGDALDRARIGEMLECVRQQSLRAGEIIRRLRVQVGKRTPVRSRVDVVQPIQEVLQLLEPDLRQSDVRVVQRVNHSDRVSIIDEIQIQQVLVNLIRNSLDAMSETDHDQRILEITTSETNDGLIEVSVSDTGTGIPAESSNKVFDAFFSSNDEGMGMGLTISRTIIENHGGRLWMMPNLQRGVTFYFSLPIAMGGSDDDGRYTKSICAGR